MTGVICALFEYKKITWMRNCNNFIRNWCCRAFLKRQFKNIHCKQIFIKSLINTRSSSWKINSISNLLYLLTMDSLPFIQLAQLFTFQQWHLFLNKWCNVIKQISTKKDMSLSLNYQHITLFVIVSNRSLYLQTWLHRYKIVSDENKHRKNFTWYISPVSLILHIKTVNMTPACLTLKP